MRVLPALRSAGEVQSSLRSPGYTSPGRLGQSSKGVVSVVEADPVLARTMGLLPALGGEALLVL
jgi:hypothetical protein